MQQEITKPTPILGDDGHVVQAGWARDDLFIYDRSKLAVNAFRVKEWDFWEVFNSKCRVVLNIFDIGFAGIAQFTYTDFDKKENVIDMMMTLFPKGKTGNPKSWKYTSPLVFKKGKSSMEFNRDGETILLKCTFPKKGIEGEFRLHRKLKDDAMVNLIPFKDPKHFVYAVKLACMPATGTLKIKNQVIEFSEQNNSWGVLDWTRAVFPHNNKWKWCIACGKVNGVPIGFNLDYGFGTESAKNMIFYGGKGHHLNEIEYQHDVKNMNAPLKITSPDHRVNLTLTPKYIEKTGVDIGLIAMKGFSTYGFFTGELILDNGDKIKIEESDQVFGWAEQFYQKW